MIRRPPASDVTHTGECRVLFRCRRKACLRSVARVYTVETYRATARYSTYPFSEYEVRRSVTFRQDGDRLLGPEDDTTCPACGDQAMRWARVSGHLNPKRKCDDRCTGAVGPQCSCSCGGANHGRMFDA